MPQPSSWQPQTEQVPSASGWQPQTERVPVSAHSRRRRTLKERDVAGEIVHPTERLAAMATQALPTIGATLGDIGGGLAGAAAVAPTVIPTGGTSALAAPAAIMGGRAAGAAGGAYVGKLAENALAPYVGLGEPGGLTAGAGQEAALQGGGALVGGVVGRGAARLGGVLTGKTARHAIANAENAVREVSKAGVKIHPSEILSDLNKVAYEEGVVRGQDGIRAVRKFAQNFLNKQPAGEWTMLNLHRFRQMADNVADPIFRQIEKARLGLVPMPGPRQQLRGRLFKNMADKSRVILRDNVPGYQVLEKEVRGAVKARKLLPKIEQGPIEPKVSNLMGATTIAGRTLLGEGARQNAGSLLSNPLFEFLLRRGIPTIGASPFGTGYE